MLPKLNKIRGVHPGDILKRELKNRGIKAIQLATSIGEHKQTISAILNKRRKVTPTLSIKLSKIFDVNVDYFAQLQASYDVKALVERMNQKNKPDFNKFREVLFWDTDFESLDWDKQKQAIIKRVLERGNEEEMDELVRFYGKELIAEEMEKLDFTRSLSRSLNNA